MNVRISELIIINIYYKWIFSYIYHYYNNRWIVLLTVHTAASTRVPSHQVSTICWSPLELMKNLFNKLIMIITQIKYQFDWRWMANSRSIIAAPCHVATMVNFTRLCVINQWVNGCIFIDRPNTRETSKNNITITIIINTYTSMYPAFGSLFSLSLTHTLSYTYYLCYYRHLEWGKMTTFFSRIKSARCCCV